MFVLITSLRARMWMSLWKQLMKKSKDGLRETTDLM